jgi:hypothetical protein
VILVDSDWLLEYGSSLPDGRHKAVVCVQACTTNQVRKIFFVTTSVSDPNPHWKHIRWTPGSGSAFAIQKSKISPTKEEKLSQTTRKNLKN